jgi:hypothetical protein
MKYVWQLPGWPGFEFDPVSIRATVEQYTCNEGHTDWSSIDAATYNRANSLVG